MAVDKNAMWHERDDSPFLDYSSLTPHKMRLGTLKIQSQLLVLVSDFISKVQN